MTCIKLNHQLFWWLIWWVHFIKQNCCKMLFCVTLVLDSWSDETPSCGKLNDDSRPDEKPHKIINTWIEGENNRGPKATKNKVLEEGLELLSCLSVSFHAQQCFSSACYYCSPPRVQEKKKKKKKLDVCWSGIGWINTVPPLFMFGMLTDDSLRRKTWKDRTFFNIMSPYDLRTICSQLLLKK